MTYSQPQCKQDSPSEKRPSESSKEPCSKHDGEPDFDNEDLEVILNKIDQENDEEDAPPYRDYLPGLSSLKKECEPCTGDFLKLIQ